MPNSNPNATNTTVLTRLLCDQPVVVTGLGSFSAAGESVTALWQKALAGRSLATGREFQIGPTRKSFVVRSAPELTSARPDWQSIHKLDRCAQMAWLAAHQAWEQAQLTGDYSPARIGMMVGSSRGPFGKVGESLDRIGQPNYPPSLSASSMFASRSGVLAQHFNLQGPGATISATGASGAFAIGLAAEQIPRGKVDAMLVGGDETPLAPAIPAQLQAAGVLGSHTEAARTCRPFDLTRNGLVLEEGSAFLILESARKAAARQAKALAPLSGWSLNLDHSGRTGVD